MVDRIAFGVEIEDMTAIVFAESKAKAKWIAVMGYWSAYGKNGWPRPTAWREPKFDGNPLKDGARSPWTREYVENFQP